MLRVAERIDWLKEALPDPSTQRKVLSENAMALYGFDDAR